MSGNPDPSTNVPAAVAAPVDDVVTAVFIVAVVVIVVRVVIEFRELSTTAHNGSAAALMVPTLSP